MANPELAATNFEQKMLGERFEALKQSAIAPPTTVVMGLLDGGQAQAEGHHIRRKVHLDGAQTTVSTTDTDGSEARPWKKYG